MKGVNGGLKHQTLLGVTGSGKSVVADTPVFVRRSGTVVCREIGPFIDDVLSNTPIESRQLVDDTELVEPRSGDEPIEVFSFDPVSGQSTWKSIPSSCGIVRRRLCSKISTQCGRSITVTSDHNFYALRNGRIQLVRTRAEIRPGDYVPVPRSLPDPESR